MQLFHFFSKFDIMTTIKIPIAQDTYQAKLVPDYHQTQHWDKGTSLRFNCDSMTAYLEDKDLTINMTKRKLSNQSVPPLT